MTLETSTTIPRDLLHRIPVLNRQRQFRIDRNAVVLFCGNLLQCLELRERAVSIVFLGVREMRLVNRQYCGKDYATDVLSFSYADVSIDGKHFIGEIVIAPKVAVNNAVRYGVSPENELRKLLVHGALHLLGYDHETDRGQMNRVQAKLMRRKFFLNPPPLTQLKVKG